jgi:hypothetical protein
MDFVKETLEWVNRERKARGMTELEDLPKGVPTEGWDCPLTLALDCDCISRDVVLWNLFDRSDSERLPECASQFVHAFDAGELPQYVRPA